MFQRVQPSGVAGIICSCQMSKLLLCSNIDSLAMETIVWTDRSGLEWIWISSKKTEKVGSSEGGGRLRGGLCFRLIKLRAKRRDTL